MKLIYTDEDLDRIISEAKAKRDRARKDLHEASQEVRKWESRRGRTMSHDYEQEREYARDSTQENIADALMSINAQLPRIADVLEKQQDNEVHLTKTWVVPKPGAEVLTLCGSKFFNTYFEYKSDTVYAGCRKCLDIVKNNSGPAFPVWAVGRKP